MSPEVVEAKLRGAEVAGRMAVALRAVARRTGRRRGVDGAAGAGRMLLTRTSSQVLDRMIVKRIAEPQWGPPIGRVLASLLEEGRQEALIQLLADRAFEWS